MEEPLKSNLQAGVGEVHLSQGTVEGTEADMGIQRKWVRVNRVKRALKGEKPPARLRGEWNRVSAWAGSQAALKGRQMPALGGDAFPSLQPLQLLLPLPPGVFPNCQLARVLQGQAQSGQQGTRMPRSVPWEQGYSSHT